MKKVMIILLVCLYGSSFLSAQTKKKIVFKDRAFYLNDTLINRVDLKTMLTNDVMSAPEFNLSESNAKIGDVFMIGGGVLALGGCAYLLIQTATGSMTWTPVYLSGAGLGLVLVGVPFYLSANNHMMKSIDIYNSKFTSNYDKKLEFNFGFTPNGVGITCKF